MDDWIDRLAGTLGVDPLSEADVVRLLSAAREVAHRVERRVTPLAAFLIGQSVGSEMTRGGNRHDSLAGALETLGSVLPDRPAET